MRTKNNRILNKIYKISPIIILSLIPLLWFKKGYLIGGVDFDFPLYPIKQFFLRMHSWNPILLGGYDQSTRFAGLFSFTMTQAVLKSIGLSLGVLQKGYFVFWYSLIGLSMYFCMSQLVRGKNIKSQIIKYLGTFFYMVNFYQLHIWMIARKGESSGAIFIPVTLGILLGFKEKMINFYKIVALSVVLFWLTSGMGINPPVVGVCFLFISLYFIYYILFLKSEWQKKELKRNVFFILTFILLFILTNLYWILPIGNSVLTYSYLTTSHSLDVFNIKGLLEATSRYNSFLNVFRLYGDNVWFDGFKGRLYLPFFANYLNNPFLILSSFIFPILAFSAILISRKKHVIFFTLMALITLFLSKGIHPPFGGMFLWMINNIPGFWVYRAPWQKFTLITILSYSYLAAITCGYLYEKIPDVIRLSRFKIRHSKVIFLVLLISIHLVYHYGFIFGRFLPTTEERKVLPGFHQKYPDYLFESAEWVNSEEDSFKMMLLPDDKANAYYWGYGAAYDISLRIFDKGLIFRQYGEGMAPPTSLDKIYNAFIDSLYNEKTPYAGKIAGLLNVRYLLHRNDFIYDWAGDDDSPEFIKDKLSKQKGITLEKSIGKWDFYKNEYELPHIYVPDNIIYVERDLDTLPKLSYKEEFGPKTAVLFSSMINKNKIAEFKNLKTTENSVKIDVNRVNPTKYFIRIENFNEKFLLVFNDKYHPQWKAYKLEVESNKKIQPSFSALLDLFKLNERTEIKDHIKVNGYANGWFVNKGRENAASEENCVIMIEYIPQRFFEMGVLTFLSTLGMVIVLIISILMKKLNLKLLKRGAK